jgi:hypothetical protein
MSGSWRTLSDMGIARDRKAALARYRELQNLEGASEADERAIAREQGLVWRRYLTLCEAQGVQPESSTNPDLGRY